MSGTITLRPARPSDAPAMVILVDIAGHGLPVHFWNAAVRRGEATSALEVGMMRALREESDFSWKKATIAEYDGEVAGMLTGYLQPDAPERVKLEDYDAIVRPLIELEALVPATWYVTVLATFARFRGRGIGSRMLARAVETTERVGARGTSLIVEDANLGARRVYEREGFEEIARRPFEPFPGAPEVDEWILMVRPR